MRPNFLVIGAMKSATTSLCAALKRHPDVFICEPKEPDYFCDDDAYARGWTYYEELFRAGAACAARGDGSTSYTKALLYPKTAERIARDLPHVKLIYIVRHPLDRLESHWVHNRLQGKYLASETFCTSLRRHPEMVDTSLYWRQINLYRQYFSDDQILVLFFDDFRRDPAAEVAKCLRFLEVGDVAIADTPFERCNVSSDRRENGRLLRRLKQTRRGVEFVLWTRAHVPRPMYTLLKQALKKKTTVARPCWDTDTKRWAARQIAPDARRFLEFYGRPSNHWEFPSAPEGNVSTGVATAS